MNHFSAVITGSSLVLAEVNDAGLTSWLIAEEARPASFQEADTTLAWYGYGRTEAWDLVGAGVSARVEQIDNLFNGVRAARLDQAVGTTHNEFDLVPASSINNGDLVTDGDRSAIYVVGGSSTECGVTKLHQVGEGQTWDQHYTGEFRGLVWCARKR